MYFIAIGHGPLFRFVNKFFVISHFFLYLENLTGKIFNPTGLVFWLEKKHLHIYPLQLNNSKNNHN
jgi:hypothetical protein